MMDDRPSATHHARHREEVSAVTLHEHFEQVAPAYESLRTTDEASVRRIRQFLPDHPVTGIDVGCGTGRYSKLLRALLPDGSLLVACDLSTGMLATLQAGNQGPFWVAPLRCTAEELPVRDGSLDLVTSFNSVHHFDLGRFLAAAARALRPDGQLFVYTRTPEQNARTIWGRHFPGFGEHEQRLRSKREFQVAIRQTEGLVSTGTRTFRYPRSSTPERLRAHLGRRVPPGDRAPQPAPRPPAAPELTTASRGRPGWAPDGQGEIAVVGVVDLAQAPPAAIEEPATASNPRSRNWRSFGNVKRVVAQDLKGSAPCERSGWPLSRCCCSRGARPLAAAARRRRPGRRRGSSATRRPARCCRT